MKRAQRYRNLRAKGTCRSELILLGSTAVLLAMGLLSETAHSAQAAQRAEGSSVAQTPKRYGSLTLDQWHERLGQLHPQATSAEEAVPAFIEIIRDETLPVTVRRTFAVALGRMGEAAQDAVPVLQAFLADRQDPATGNYLWAARALGLLGVSARDAAPELLEIVFDDRIPPEFRTVPIEALAQIGSAHPDVLPGLVRLLQYQATDSGSQVSPGDAAFLRGVAAEALAVVGPEAELAAPILMRIVRDRSESDNVRRKAILALGALEYRGAAALPALLESLEFDTSLSIQTAVSQALARIGQPAVPYLMTYLRHPDPHARRRATEILRETKADVTPALPVLRELLSDPDDTVRLHVAQTLAARGVTTETFGPAAIELLTSEDRQVRMQAMNLLVDFPPSGSQRERLRALTEDDRPQVRAIARKTLDRLADGQ